MPLSAEARASLCAWFGRNARDLPWRRRPTAYRVWISEVMLQQTRVEAAREHYRRFLKRFPSVSALASAPEEEALRLWSGLGYYRRARMLYAAAHEIVRRHGGRLPRDATALRALPGIGRYTAGAIASIAFGLAEPIVDGNVERVFARWLALDEDIKSAPAQKRLWALAEGWVRDGAEEGHAPGVLNQALMELGALVCAPASPRCDACPVRAHCKAHGQGRPDAFPARAARAVRKRVEYQVLGLLDRQGRVLMVRRGGGGSLLPDGMWELPHAVGRDSLVGEFFEPSGPPVTVRHAIMDTDLSLRLQPARLIGPAAVDGRWFSLEEAERQAIASATRKLLRKLSETVKPVSVC